MQWIADNIGSIVVCLGVCALLGLLICSLIKRKKQGKGGCGCGCEGCAMRGACHPQKTDTDKNERS